MEHRGRYDESIKVLEEAVRLQSTPPAEQADLLESLTFLADSEQPRGWTDTDSDLVHLALAGRLS